MTRQLVVIGTAVMTTLLALVVLWQFHIVVIYVLISLALAATVRPIARSESRRNFATRLLLILLYAVSIGLFGLLIFIVGRLLIGDLQELAQTADNISWRWLVIASKSLSGAGSHRSSACWKKPPCNQAGNTQLLCSAIVWANS